MLQLRLGSAKQMNNKGDAGKEAGKGAPGRGSLKVSSEYDTLPKLLTLS